MSTIAPDTIDVRSDERFDETKLAAYLRGKLPGSNQPLTVRQFDGGAANLTYLLDLAAPTTETRTKWGLTDRSISEMSIN